MRGDDSEDAAAGADSGGFVDARAARGVQVGDHNTQVIYSYHGTWTDGVAPAPLIGVAGEVESPYRGLGWFSERDAPFFFGRDAAIDEMLQRLSQRVRQPGILLVSGVSGAGKSSLLRAGVLPRIRGQGLEQTPQAHSWPCVVLTAGHDPLDEMALSIAQVAGADAAVVRRELREDPEALAVLAAQAAHTLPVSEHGGPRGLLLVVDQFEQVFTQCSDESQRRAFVTALHAAATSRHADAVILVVLVVRADFEARCADYEPLIDAIQHHYLVTAMTERQLRMAITEPAKQAGSRVDDDLAEQLLRETRVRAADSVPAAATVSAAGVLPLLSYALDRTWRLRAGDTVTVADYERSGGLEGAVAGSAQRAYDSLTRPQQRAARRVFTRLVISGPEGADTADRVQRSDLAWDGVDSGDVDAVLAVFTDERLLTLGAQTVEISHEVLLSTWPLLRDTWLAETRENRAVCARLRAAAAEWARNSHDPAHLYSGSVLDTAATVAEQVAADPARYPPLGATETQFLDAGIRAQRRRTRQRRAAAGVLIFLVVALAAATLVAFRASQQSAEQRDKAVARELISNSERLATTDPVGSRVSALAAWRIDPTPEARYAMLAASRNRAAARFVLPGTMVAVTLSRDGKTLATFSNAGLVQVWDVASHDPIGEPLEGSHSEFPSLTFSPDGKRLVTRSDDGAITVWDVTSPRPIGKPLAESHSAVVSLTFSPDGTTLVTAGKDGKVQSWDVASLKPIGEPLDAGGDRPVKSLEFRPDGKALITVSDDGTVRLWDAEHGQPLGEVPIEHKGSVTSLAFSPDGTILTTGRDDGTVQLWDLEHGRSFGEARTKYNQPVTSLAFSPGGTILTTGLLDGTVLSWDLEHEASRPETFAGHHGSVRSSAFSPDGKILTTASIDGTVQSWYVEHNPPRRQTLGSNPVSSMEFSPDGKVLVTADKGGVVQSWDVAGLKPLGEPFVAGGGQALKSLEFSLDGKMLATASEDGTVRLWDVAHGRSLGEALIEHRLVIFGPDGKTFVTADKDGTLQLWDAASLKPHGEPLTAGGDQELHSLEFSPDGKALATASEEGMVRLWDPEHGRSLGEALIEHNGLVTALAFSPDSRTLVTASIDGTVRTWDVASLQPVGEPLAGHTGLVTTLAFSPDSKTLATASENGATVIDDSEVRLWDVASLQPVGEPLVGHSNGLLFGLVFGPDGTTLTGASGNGTVLSWDVGFTADPASFLCASIPGQAAHEQWKTYVPSVPGLEYRELCP
ncbi:hypothetical protein [Nocardia abscessus]|uniref:nSTAND1 domain-containing NTPase n=1 Tax=Nocardia abscessus TaxID=120957 RepID=UPI0024583EB9|nr:hypothetical protein [Nocardia abscessus]